MISIYHSSNRTPSLSVLERPKAGAWISIVAPTTTELDDLAEQYNLDRDLLADATDIYEVPRIESDGGKTYIYTRYCYPEGKEIATEPLLIIYTGDHIITVMRRETTMLGRLVAAADIVITTQKTKTLLQILAEVNSSYRVPLNRVSKQILRVRAQLRQSNISNRDFIGIIEIEEDLNEYLAALQTQSVVIAALIHGRYIRLLDDDRDMIEDIDHTTGELIELTKSRLRTLVNMRQAYDAIATNNLNNTFKRLTSIAIFLSIPTVISGIWGMNVGVPFRDQTYGFWIVLGAITGITTVTIWIFHRKKWL